MRISDLVLDEDWDDATLATVIRLLAWMRQRWARQGLSAEEASSGFLNAGDLARITRLARFDDALGRMAALQEVLTSFQCEPVGCDPGVYWIRAGDVVKIGRTIDLERRLAQIRRRNADAEVIGFEPSLAFVQLEKRLHQEHLCDRVEGEWFRASEAILARAQHAAGTRRAPAERVRGARSASAGLTFSWSKVADFQGWSSLESGKTRPDDRPLRRHDARLPPHGSSKEDTKAQSPGPADAGVSVELPLGLEGRKAPAKAVPPKPWALEAAEAIAVAAKRRWPGAIIPSSFVTWARDLERIRAQEAQIRDLVAWYTAPALDRAPYVPEARSGRAFREKFNAIAAARHRIRKATRGAGGPPDPSSRAERMRLAQRLYSVEHLIPDDTVEALAAWEAKGKPRQKWWWLPAADRERFTRALERGSSQADPEPGPVRALGGGR
jgi:hypothetical protein